MSGIAPHLAFFQSVAATIRTRLADGAGLDAARLDILSDEFLQRVSALETEGPGA